MSQGGYVTLVGYVAREPTLRTTGDGRQVADLRVGATSRIYDKAADQWRDGETSYYTVNCWRKLAGHVRASLHKGDPVMVKGRFRTRTYEDKQNRIRTEVEIVADTIGHDLSRGIANYLRPAEHQHTEDASGMVDGDRAPTVPDPEIDEDQAVDELSRELDRELTGDGQLTDGDQPFRGGLAGRDTARPVPEESGEPAGASVPF